MGALVRGATATGTQLHTHHETWLALLHGQKVAGVPTNPQFPPQRHPKKTQLDDKLPPQLPKTLRNSNV
eukprot:6219407-Amphidinium_carterae.1